LTECFEIDGQFFRVKANAESHCRRNKIDAAKIVTHAKAEVEKAKADKKVQN